MEFRSPTVAAQQNANALKYLTESLSNRSSGERLFASLVEELGNVVDGYPDWHPLLTLPPKEEHHVQSPSQLKTYKGLDHTVYFVRGFVTCPYNEQAANAIVEAVLSVQGLAVRRLEEPLYHDGAYPVVVEATSIETEADGTIKGRLVLAWFVGLSANEALTSSVAETWWNTRSNILGYPHGSRSSLLVNQHTGIHLRKILEAMNDSGMFGPIKESSLAMLSAKSRGAICENLIRTAVSCWDKTSETFEFELRGEKCKASVRDTWSDGEELSVSVYVGDQDLRVSGHFYPKDKKITHVQPTGKKRVAIKFV